MIVILTGPPGAGKSSVSTALAQHFEKCLVIPIDDIRDNWVRTGNAMSVDWNDETERQFTLAEDGATDIAVRYAEAGFAVIIDHCRNLKRWNEICAERLANQEIVRVCLLPNLETNLKRNLERTSKSFDQTLLEPIIYGMNPTMAQDRTPEWIMLDTTKQTVEQTAQEIWELTSSPSGPAPQDIRG